MSRWSVWQIDRAGRPERVGSYAHGADARRVLRAAITRGAAVDPEGVIDDGDDRGISPTQCRMIEAAAEEWLATASTVPAPAAVVEIPAPEEVEPVGVGAATEPPPSVEAPLPVAFEPPVVEPSSIPRSVAVAAIQADELRGTIQALADQLLQHELTIAALRADLRARGRTIANLRAELAAAQAHPVVRITAPRVRRVVRAETPVETLHRRLAEIAGGRR